MKKVLLIALFLGAFVSANAVGKNVLEVKDCHEEACIAIGEAEEAFPEFEISAEQIYSYVYSECMG